jgi:Ca2+-binding RTX toxin-like protein
MAKYEWKFGAEGSGLYFTITFDDVAGTFSVTSLEGSFDLNALWFSDGDTSSDGFTLSKADNSLNMNGSNTVWADDGTSSTEKVAWDDYIKLSNPGLGSEGEEKGTFISAGDPGPTVFNLADLNLSNFTLANFDPETAVLGVRATSVNGDGSIKWVDKESELVEEEENLPPTDLHLSIASGFAAAAANGNIIEADGADLLVGTLVVADPDIGDTHTLTLVAGDTRFNIVGDQLYLNDGESIEAGDGTFTITVKAVDSALNEYYETFTFITDGTGAAATNNITGNPIGGLGTAATPVTGDDLIFGFSNNDTLNGSSGDDALFGGSNNDALYGGDGNDQLFGGHNTDLLYGGAGDDTLYGGIANDTIYGDSGNDLIFGGDGDDILNGGAGDDTISDGLGNDLIVGGDGADIINLAADTKIDVLDYNLITEAGDVVNGFNAAASAGGGNGGDVVNLADLLDTGTFGPGNLATAIAGGYVSLTDNAGNAEIRVDLDGTVGGVHAPVLVVTLNGIDLGATPTALDDNIVVN